MATGQLEVGAVHPPLAKQAQEAKQMEKLNPTIQEFEEENTEQEFLNGSALPVRD